MTVFKIFLFIFLNFLVTFAKISDKRLCFNKDCSEPVSLAKTLLRYTSDDSRILSFLPNQQVKIFSKSAGSRLDLWGAEINGKRGYVPTSYVRESKIFRSNLEFLVETEGVDDPAAISQAVKTIPETIPADTTGNKLDDDPKPVENNEIFPNTVTPAYEIIDGTTILLNDPADFSSTPSSVDNLVEQSEKIATEPVEVDTKKVAEHLNPETKTNNEKENESKSDEDIPDLSEEKEIVTNSVENQIEENNNKQEENEKSVNTSEEELKENKSAEITSGEKDVTIEDNNVYENKSSEITSEENIKEELKDEKVESSEENETKEVKIEDTNVYENKSAEITSEENGTKEDKNVYENKSAENIKDEKVENKSAEIKDVNIEDKNVYENKSDENIDQQLKEKNLENKNDEFENKSAENVGEEDGEVEDGDDENGEEQDEEEEEEEEVPENVENPINAQKQSTKISNENLDVKSEEITKEQLNNTSNETTYTEPPPPPLNENIKKSASAIDMNQFDRINNETNSHENETNVEEKESAEIIEQEKTEPGVPSLFPKNPLSYFSSQEVKNDDVKQNVETNTQVPEISTSDTSASETIESKLKSSVTTETPIDQEDPLPYEPLPPPPSDSFTENPNILLNDKTPEFIEIQQDTTIKQSELLKDINSDFSFENQNYDSLEYTQNNIGIGSVEEMTAAKALNDQTTSDTNQNIENIQNSSENTSDEPGFFSNIFSNIFGSKQQQQQQEEEENTYDHLVDTEHTENNENSWQRHAEEENPSEKYLMSEQSDMQSCNAGKDSSCPFAQNQQNYIRSENGDISWSYEIPENAYTILLYLTLTAITVLLFSLGYYYIEKRRKDGKLIASINELEQKLLVTTKECHLAQNELKITKEKLESVEDTSCGSNDALQVLNDELDQVRSTKLELEEQIASLESELEKATETGMEMSEMLNELLTSQSGNEHLMKTINGLQKQLNDQKVTLNHTQLKLSEKNTENELLRTELQVTNEKVAHLQAELDKMVVNILSVQEEKSKIEIDYDAQIEKLTTDHHSLSTQLNKELESLKDQIQKYNSLVDETKRELDLKCNEYDLLKQSMKEMEGVQSNKESMKALLDVSHVKAEVLQLREEKHKLNDKLQKEIDAKLFNEKEVQVMLQEVTILKDKFEEAEKEKVEAETRLEVLSSYFKEREAQYQKEINENESKWMQKEGEATSTIERIKWIQEELQNYKSQNELLKKEILDQEVSLKSQISMLEKKNHENWLVTRQAERKLEESKQEASQLRNRLTIVEKNLNNTSQMNDENMIQNHSNGDVAVSPLHMTNPENPGSPPLLFPHRDHMTTSPPLQVLPPFMPPPHGVHFMPPPPLSGVPPFMPPPPPLFPGDHRPPPLGRMSSPPLHGRYSPDSRAYSPYDRDDSPPLSPTYTDDYRRRTPPPNVNHLPPRNYSPYSGGKQRYWDDKMEYRGQHHRNKSRPHKGMSSAGSGNSDESLENSGRHSGRV